MEVLNISNFDSLTEKDINEIITVYKKAFDYTISKIDILDWFNYDNRIMIVKYNNEVVGLLRYYKPTNNDIFTEVFNTNNIVMLSDLASIKKGAGKLLINNLIEYCRYIDISYIFLIPEYDNLIEYYEKFNFKECKKLRKDYRFPSVVMYLKI